MKEIKIYEAMDGRKFYTKLECEKYELELFELKQKELEESDEYKRKKADIKRLREISINFYGIPINEYHLDPDCWYFTWFKVNNDEDVNLLQEYVDENIGYPASYPSYICVESEEEFFYDEKTCDVGGQYALLFDSCIREVKWFFGKFGYDVQITERNK